MKYLVVSIVLCLMVACSSSSKKIEVRHLGALKKVMKENNLSAHADLTDFSDSTHLYALGALEGLKGEFMVLDGTSFLTRLNQNLLINTASFDAKAAFMVYAIVPKWNSFSIPSAIKTVEQFEVFVYQTAKENKVDVSQPFPFLIEGMVTSASWHVVDWDESDSVHTHLKHVESGRYGSKLNQVVTMLGFYSDKHHGVFTHHTRNLHIHAFFQEDHFIGHIDNFILGEGMTLKLPK